MRNAHSSTNLRGLLATHDSAQRSSAPPRTPALRNPQAIEVFEYKKDENQLKPRYTHATGGMVLRNTLRAAVQSSDARDTWQAWWQRGAVAARGGGSEGRWQRDGGS